MAKPHRLKELEEVYGDLNNVIPTLLEKHQGSQKEVANQLGVSSATISNWLNKNHYIPVTKYIKKEPQCSN